MENPYDVPFESKGELAEKEAETPENPKAQRISKREGDSTEDRQLTGSQLAVVKFPPIRNRLFDVSDSKFKANMRTKQPQSQRLIRPRAGPIEL